MSNTNSVFVNERTIVFSGVVDPESVGKIIISIKAIEDEDNEKEANLKNYKREPIKLIISTNGGSVYDAFGLIDIIESCKTKVYTYGYGQIMSAGLYIFIAGHKRFCGKYTAFMFHETSFGVRDYSSVVNSRASEVNRVTKVLDTMLISKTKVTEKLLKKWYADRETYIDSKEALKLGIVNEIV